MCPNLPLPAKPSVKRGRRAVVWFSMEDVEASTGVPAVLLSQLLDILPGAMPGAERHEARGWIVPSTTLRALQEPRVGIELRQMATVEEVATAMRMPSKLVSKLCKDRVLDGLKVGRDWRVDVSCLYRPETWQRRPLSGFLRKVKQKGRGMVPGGPKVSAMADRRAVRDFVDSQQSLTNQPSGDSQCPGTAA